MPPFDPTTIPALREWSPGRGTTKLGGRIVADASLAGEAAILGEDLGLPVVSGPRPRAGDIVLRTQDVGLGGEGYRLTIDDRVEVAGATAAGVFHGTRTVAQLARATGGRLPCGAARDWPRQRERGVMLDAGRTFFSPDYLAQTIRAMADLKLNTLHLHLSDTNAFRLVSERFPDLAAPQAYTRADIRRLEAVARAHHVTIVPEIDMPAHAEALLAVRPELRFACESMAGWTLDVTKPATRAFTQALIDEFAPLFGGPEFHIGTDEYPGQPEQERCPELVAYAAERGFGSTADVFVDFINAMNRAVRAHGKRTVIWNWWDLGQRPTIHPDRDVKVQAWTAGPERYLDMGYEVVASPSDTLYVTPGLGLLPDPAWLYEQWEPLEHPRLAGYQLAVWADNRIGRPERYFDEHLRGPRAVLADRLWGGPRYGTAADFLARAR